LAESRSTRFSSLQVAKFKRVVFILRHPIISTNLVQNLPDPVHVQLPNFFVPHSWIKMLIPPDFDTWNRYICINTAVSPI
jgi:hypothetical protein